MPWIIDIDHIADTDCPEGTNCNAKGLCGGNQYEGDDGELYYTGRSDGLEPDADCDAGFAPLYDFGMPNAGCTEIKYFENGRWVTL